MSEASDLTGMPDASGLAIPGPPTGARRPIRDAATVVLLRPGADGPEVLLLRRHGRAGFAADAWVFPGGVVDDADAQLPRGCYAGLDPEALVGRMAAPADLVLALHVAAVREAFEEAGLLLGRHRDGRSVDVTSQDASALRAALADREADADLAGWLAQHEIVLDLGALTPLSRWITPRVESRRYDTFFFVARAPVDQVADHDRIETTAQRWLRPADAVAQHRAGELHMIHPTVKTLEALAAHATVDRALDAAREASLAPILPHVERTAEGWRLVHPGEPDFPYEDYRDELERR